jgi:hypothetical protein
LNDFASSRLDALTLVLYRMASYAVTNLIDDAAMLSLIFV